jgi:hypothetical protein
MSKKIIPANYERNEFDKEVFTEAIVYTKQFDVGGVATKITNAALTTFGLADVLAAGGTRIQFDTLVGNLPWSSYSKYTISEPRTTTPPIPLASLPSAGSVTITEGATSEVMYYGSVTWTSATAGYLNNVKRSSTTNAFTAAATGAFTNVIPVREKILIWNRTVGTLYIGNSAAMLNTPTNCVKLAFDGQWGIWLEPLQDLWVLPSTGGLINIAEYR